MALNLRHSTTNHTGSSPQTLPGNREEMAGKAQRAVGASGGQGEMEDRPRSSREKGLGYALAPRAPGCVPGTLGPATALQRDSRWRSLGKAPWVSLHRRGT